MKTQSAIILVLLAGAMPAAFADSGSQQNQQQQSGGAAPEKVDVSDIENKYWAPKDTDFSVVQNRTFTKEHKIFLSAQFGPDISPTNYVTGNQIGLDGNYFFNERYGLQFSYLDSFLHTNASYGSVVTQGGAPDYGKMRSYYGLGFDWVPFYSKMSFLGKKIMYFDMAITPTIGLTHYDQEYQGGESGANAFTYGVDITQYYFFTNHFAFRVDLKNQWYGEQVLKYYQGDSSNPTGSVLRTQTDREMIFLFGFTYYFGLGN